VIISHAVNSHLSNPINLIVDQNLRRDLNIELRNHDVLSDVIAEIYRKNKYLINENKVCLGSDLYKDTDSVSIFKAGYFHGEVTNELVTKIVQTQDLKPTAKYTGWDFLVKSNTGTPKLKSIEETDFSNHIGISTLAFSSDNKFVLWRQDESSRQNAGLIMPTGSGSVNWKDWKNIGTDKTLSSLVTIAMEREMLEESSLTNVPIKMATRIFGYYRRLERGGKPEFFGITRTNIHSKKFQPQKKEVRQPYFIDCKNEFENLTDLKIILEREQKKNISVPLYMIIDHILAGLFETGNDVFNFLLDQR
jgi:hypothetical protein